MDDCRSIVTEVQDDMALIESDIRIIEQNIQPLENKVSFSPIESFDVIMNIQLLVSYLCFSSFKELTRVLGVYFLRLGFLK
jgi:hypothetical protein